MNPQENYLNAQWLQFLKGELDQCYMQTLWSFLDSERASGKTLYPQNQDIFNAFKLAPLEQVKVVVLGQDPYHGPGQAHGLSFSVPRGAIVPPSLRNIYKEQQTDLGVNQQAHGNLQSWATQGVLLLNAVLTVEHGQAGSHQGKGWEQFTDRVIEVVNQQTEHVVFMLWGAYAQKKGRMIDRAKHLVLEAPHPSPLSAYRGFFGCGHFSAANTYLQHHGKQEIEWQIS